MIKRGDVWWISFDPTVGSEIRKTRPAIVVSNDAANRFSTMITVVPLTSQIQKLYPGEALVEVDGKPGKAMCDQIRAVDRTRLVRKLGALSVGHAEVLDRALLVSLGLPL